MNTKIFNVITFVAGAAIGSFVTWRILDEKYEEKVNEEVSEEIRKYREIKDELVRKKIEEIESGKYTGPIETASKTPEKPSLSEYIRTLNDAGYGEPTDYSEIANQKEGGGESMDKSRPYVISPDEFDTIDDYVTESLTYFADGILIDDWGNVVENVDEIIGKDSLTHFGEYEDDSVFVRNDGRETDYEILLDSRNFRDVKELPPYCWVGDE